MAEPDGEPEVLGERVAVGVRVGDLVGRAEGVSVWLAVEVPLGEPVIVLVPVALFVDVPLLEAAPLLSLQGVRMRLDSGGHALDLERAG